MENTPTYQTRLGQVLVSQERGVSWLARKTGYGYMHTWRMVTGRRPISSAFLEQAALALGVPESDLLEEPAAVVA